MKRRIIFYIVIFLLMFSVGCVIQSRQGVLIKPGEGYSNFKVGESTIYEVIAKYGTDFQFENGITDFSDGSAIHQYRYDYRLLGVEFESDVEEPQSDNPRDYILKYITFRQPFKAVTSENIVLNQSKKEEIIKTYGDGYKEVNRYKNVERMVYNEMGISFTINKTSQVIEEITIFKP